MPHMLIADQDGFLNEAPIILNTLTGCPAETGFGERHFFEDGNLQVHIVESRAAVGWEKSSARANARSDGVPTILWDRE